MLNMLGHGWLLLYLYVIGKFRVCIRFNPADHSNYLVLDSCNVLWARVDDFQIKWERMSAVWEYYRLGERSSTSSDLFSGELLGERLELYFQWRLTQTVVITQCFAQIDYFPCSASQPRCIEMRRRWDAWSRESWRYGSICMTCFRGFWRKMDQKGKYEGMLIF